MRALSVSAANQRPDLRSGDQYEPMRGQLTSDSRERRTLLSGDCHKWSSYKTPPAAPGPLPWQPGRMCSPSPGPAIPAPVDWWPRSHNIEMSSLWVEPKIYPNNNWLLAIVSHIWAQTVHRRKPLILFEKLWRSGSGNVRIIFLQVWDFFFSNIHIHNLSFTIPPRKNWQ